MSPDLDVFIFSPNYLSKVTIFGFHSAQTPFHICGYITFKKRLSSSIGLAICAGILEQSMGAKE
jgi:hypothetical protein